jgi:hypothetical protein
MKKALQVILGMTCHSDEMLGICIDKHNASIVKYAQPATGSEHAKIIIYTARKGADKNLS